MRILPPLIVCLGFTAPTLAQTGGFVDVLNHHVSGAETPAVDPPAGLGWASGAPTLRRGSTGDAVGLAQTLLGDALAAAGQPRPAIDNDFGPGTERAVERVQALAGLPQTGVLDAATWRALRERVPAHPLGAIPAFGGEPIPARYRRNNSGAADIAPQRIARKDAPTVVVFESKMAIDADGAGDAWKSDPHGQPQTSLLYSDGRSLNPTRLHFVVLPIGMAARVPRLRLGDVVAVTYRGRTTYAIYGDNGPRTKIGEGSIKLAETLGIDPDPVQGGTRGGVIYMVFPGSGTGRPLPQDEIDRRGRQLLRTAGGRPPA